MSRIPPMGDSVWRKGKAKQMIAHYQRRIYELEFAIGHRPGVKDEIAELNYRIQEYYDDYPELAGISTHR